MTHLSARSKAMKLYLENCISNINKSSQNIYIGVRNFKLCPYFNFDSNRTRKKTDKFKACGIDAQ